MYIYFILFIFNLIIVKYFYYRNIMYNLERYMWRKPNDDYYKNISSVLLKDNQIKQYLIFKKCQEKNIRRQTRINEYRKNILANLKQNVLPEKECNIITQSDRKCKIIDRLSEDIIAIENIPDK
jgi:hypothetical protein